MKTDKSRRIFLSKMGMCAGALAALPLLNACAGVTRADLPQNMAASLNLPQLSPEAYRTLACAALAASSHNSQPWRVQLQSQSEWLIGADTERHLKTVDPEGRELALSMGCFMENLETAAAYFGLALESEVVNPSNFAADMLRVKTKPGSPSGGDLKLLQLRRTLRKGYSNNALSSVHVSALARLAAGGELHFFAADSSQGAYLAEGAAASFVKQSASDAAQAELAHWIRFSDREAKAARDGLTPESMEIGGFAGWYVRNFMNSKSVMSADFRRRGNDGAKEQAACAGGWLVLCSRNASTPELLSAGRIFERLQCQARGLNIAMHPMSQMLEEQPWRDEIRARLATDGLPQFVLRCGYVKDFAPPVSLRRPPEAFAYTNL